MRRSSVFRVLVLGVVCGLVLLALPAGVGKAAGCTPLPADKGKLAQKVSVESTATYAMWIRQISNPVDRDSVFVQIDDTCPVVAGDNLGKAGFIWTNRQGGEVNKRLLFHLAAGTHTVVITGREAGGEGIDRVLFTSNLSCVPVNAGDMCVAKPAEKPQAKHHWWIVILCILVGAGALGLLIWKYIRFKPAKATSSEVIVGNLPGETSNQPKLVQFAAQNKLLVFMCGWMMMVAVVVGFVAADTPGRTFEAEDASPSGNVMVVENGSASGGKYVAFIDAPTTPAANSPAPAPAQQKSAAPTPSRGPGSSPPPPSNAPPVAATCTGGKHTPGNPDGMGGCWPGPGNTGVPAGTVLTAYTGSCTITANNTVIDSKTINCDLVIQASGVVITKSKINGSVSNDEDTTGHSFTIFDSEIDAGNRGATGLESRDFTATRLHIYGGNRSVNCWYNCSITDSYVHGQFRDNTGTAHESGIRMGQLSTIRHNTILCDAPEVPPDAGCSADLTGYGDFGPVQNNVIDKNLFMATPSGGYCSYGGSSAGKPYSGQTNHITFTGNVYQRGTMPSDHGQYVCGYYGSNTAFDVNAPGNVWSNNTFDDGTAVSPQN